MNPTIEEVTGIKLVGLDLGRTTTNENGQSNIDCGSLWQKFEEDRCAEKILNKTGNEVYAVYYGYEGDHTQPFRYFIGCRVTDNDEVPEGLDRLTIPAGTFRKITASGKMPDCIVNAWKEVWTSDFQRGYRFDFELYDERSRNWNDAEIDIYLS